MDLMLNRSEKKRSYVDVFIKSEIVNDLLTDIFKATRLDIALIDLHGKIINTTGFYNDFKEELQDNFSHFLKNEIVNTGFVSLPQVLQVTWEDNSFFVVSRMYSRKRSLSLGYFLGGPFYRESIDDIKTDRIIPAEKYPLLINALKKNRDKIKVLPSSQLETVLHIFDSYGRIGASLFEEKAQSLKSMERLTSLYEINSSLNQTLDLQRILQMVLNKGIDLLDAKNGSILLLDENKEYLKIFVAHGLPENIINNSRTKIGDGIAGWVAKEGKPQLLKKGVKDDRSSLKKAAHKLSSAISVPIICNDEVMGVLNVSGKNDDTDFINEEMELLQALADNAANAIRNARLYKEVNRKVDELSVLFKLSGAIVSSLNRKEVLQQIMDNAIKMLNASAGSLMIIDPETDIMEIEVAVGLPEKVIKETRIRMGEGIAGKVAQEQKPRLLKKGIKEQESKSEIKAIEIPSALCVPMIFRDSVIGVLNVKGKPGGGNFGESNVELLTMLASQAAIAIVNAELHKSLKSLFVNSIKALANAIEARDEYTRGHSERVTEYSVKMAEMLEFEHDEIEKIRYAALLHDIGKIKIKEEILNKPGRLTNEEFKIITEHPTFGAKIMSPVKEFREILPYMYHHHERFASGGYPDGVKGDSIPLAARIISVADAFDAMTSDRPYRTAMDVEKAVGEINRNSGVQFDPRIVKVFNQLYDEEREWILAIIDSSKIIREEE